MLRIINIILAAILPLSALCSSWTTIAKHPDRRFIKISSEATVVYMINDDQQSVTLYSAKCGGRLTYICASPNLKSVTDPTGKEYPVTGIGNPWGEPTSMCIKNVKIPSNVQYIYDNSLPEYCPAHGGQTIGITMAEDCEFLYIGSNAIWPSANFPLRIASGGTLSGPMALNDIELHDGAKLCTKSNHMFRSPSSTYDIVRKKIICHSLTPPQIISEEGNASIFDTANGYTSEYSTLYVPEEAVESYRADTEWGKFEKIYPIGHVEEPETPPSDPDIIECPANGINADCGTFTYKIVDRDNKTLSLIKIQPDKDGKYPSPDLTQTVQDSDGTPYIITELGGDNMSITDEKTSMEFVVTSNIRRINDNALYTIKPTINPDCSFDYIGHCALYEYQGNLNIADGGILTNNWGIMPPRLKLGNDVTLVISDLTPSSCCLYSHPLYLNQSFKIEVSSATPPKIMRQNGETSGLTLFPKETSSAGNYYASGILCTPDETLETYKTDTEWGRFTNIMTISEAAPVAGTEFHVYKSNSGEPLGGHIFKVNEDTSTAAWIGIIKGSYPYDEYPYIDLSKEITDSKNNRYIITEIGDGVNSIPAYSQSIPANIKHLNRMAIDLSSSVSLLDGTAFDYVGFGALPTYFLNGTLTIADNGTLMSGWGGLGDNLILGKNVNLICNDAYMLNLTTYYGYTSAKSITSRSITPPQIQYVGNEEGVTPAWFIDERCYTYPLYVPEEALEAYKADKEWGKFTDIRAIGDESGTSSIEDVATDETNANSEWYTIAGQRLTEQPVTPGIYIEVRGNRSYKIAIK